MIITHQITMELNRSRPLEPVCVMQDDRYSRDVCILLTLDDDPWPIPDGARAVIHFEKPTAQAAITTPCPTAPPPAASAATP